MIFSVVVLRVLGLLVVVVVGLRVVVGGGGTASESIKLASFVF